MRFFDHGAGNNRAILQHIFQVHQVAVMHVLGKIIGVMEVDDALLMGLHNILGQQNALGDILADLASHIVALHRVHGGIFVGIFLLDLFVVALDESQDLLVRGVGFTHQGTGIAISNITAGQGIGAVGHDLFLHQILDLLHRWCVAHNLAFVLHFGRNLADLGSGQLVRLAHLVVALGDGNIKIHFAAAAFNNFHRWLSPSRAALSCM